MAKAKVIEFYNGRYKGSLDEKTCNQIDSLLELGAKGGSVTELRNVVYDIKAEVDNIIQGRGYYKVEKSNYLGELRNEQTIGVALMYYAKSCLLGDSVGLGKTVEIAGLCNLLQMDAEQQNKEFKYIFLTKGSIVKQVREEMVRFTGEYVELLQDGGVKSVEKMKSYFEGVDDMMYSIVGPHSLLKQSVFASWLKKLSDNGTFPYELLVIDESSFLGGASTNEVVKAFKVISKFFKRVIFLNATPFGNNLLKFFNQLNLIDNKMLPTKQSFEKEYVIYDYRGMYPRPSGKYRNSDKFMNLVGYRYFARTRREKGAEMRNCKGEIVLSSLSLRQKELMRKTEMFRFVYDCPTYLDSSISFTEDNVPKLASLRGILEKECKNEAVLMYVYNKETQKCISEWLSSKGYTNRVLNGDTKAKERFTIIDEFKEKKFQVLLTNVQEGLNFGKCNYCIFYSFDSDPSKMIQFEGRTTRDFHIENKNIYILCSEGKEYENLLGEVRLRAKATKEFTNTDLSLVLDILTGKK